VLFPQKPPCFPSEILSSIFPSEKTKQDKDRQKRQGHDRKDKQDKGRQKRQARQGQAEKTIKTRRQAEKDKDRQKIQECPCLALSFLPVHVLLVFSVV
jgi:hypothetical protein